MQRVSVRHGKQAHKLPEYIHLLPGVFNFCTQKRAVMFSQTIEICNNISRQGRPVEDCKQCFQVLREKQVKNTATLAGNMWTEIKHRKALQLRVLQHNGYKLKIKGNPIHVGSKHHCFLIEYNQCLSSQENKGGLLPAAMKAGKRGRVSKGSGKSRKKFLTSAATSAGWCRPQMNVISQPESKSSRSWKKSRNRQTLSSSTNDEFQLNRYQV